MSVELVTSSTPELVEAMERLIPQLSRTAPALTAQQCADLVAQPGVFLFVFRPDADAPTGAASQAGPECPGDDVLPGVTAGLVRRELARVDEHLDLGVVAGHLREDPVAHEVDA